MSVSPLVHDVIYYIVEVMQWPRLVGQGTYVSLIIVKRTSGVEKMRQKNDVVTCYTRANARRWRHVGTVLASIEYG